MSDPDGPLFADLREPDDCVIDPGDTLADPERHVRLRTADDASERRDRDADALLSDYGSAAIHHRRRGDD